jgi:signal peptide peptidase SppA
MANPNIGAVVVDIDSPGGEVSGLEELATKIYKYRGTKPMVAVANTWAASAAYRIGTAFDELDVTPSGEIGSIGTYTKHTDYSKMLEKEGVETTIVSAGEFKAEFNPYEPLSEAAKAELQASVDHYNGMFVKAVAKHRGVTVATVKKDFGRGRMIRAKDAVELGMADRVATLEETIRRVGGMLSSRAKARADHARRKAELEELESS